MSTFKIPMLFLPPLLALAGIAAAAQDPEIALRPPPPGWASRASFPLGLDIRSRRGGEFRISTITGAAGSHTVRRTVSLAPDSSTRVEMTLPGAAYYSRVRIDGAGAELSQTLAMPSFADFQLNDRYPPPLVCVNNYLLREYGGLEESERPENAEIASINLDDLPGRWQSYSGFVGVLVMDPAEAGGLRQVQREALVLWVKWLGGRLWLAGEGGEAAARGIGFDLDGKPEEIPGNIRRHRQMNGFLFIQPRVDVGALARSAPRDSPTNPLASYYQGEYGEYQATPGNWLTSSFGGVSTNAIIVVLIALGLLLGPLNFWYIARRKNPLLFFFTTPIIALIGTLGILGASVWSEGLGGSYNQCAVLVRGGGGEAMLFDGRGVRSGFFASTPRFSSQALVLPFRNYGSHSQNLITDVTDGVLLAGGWLTPRSTSGYLVVQPVVSRMNLEIVGEGDEYLAVNDLGYTVTLVAAELPGGGYGWAENIPPGGRARLRREAGSDRLDRLCRSAKLLFGDSPSFAGVSLAASCEGLPYIDGGGLDASRRRGEFYYVRAGDGRGEARP